MARTSIVVLLLSAVVLVTGGAYFIVFPRAREVQLSEATASMAVTGRLLQEADVADGNRLVRKLDALASRPSLLNLLRDTPSGPERTAWLGKLRSEAAGLTTAARAVAPVDTFFILNHDGLGLVSSEQPNWTGQAPTDNQKALEAIRQASQGGRRVLLISSGGKLLRAVAVPVIVGGNIRAILYATFPLDDTLLKARSSDLHLDMAIGVVTSKGLAAVSMPDEVKQRFDEVLNAGDIQAAKVIDGRTVTPRVVDGPSARWIVAGYPVLANGGQGLCGIILLRNVNAMQKSFSSLMLYLFGLGGVVFIVLTVFVTVFGGRMSKALRQLEQDALEMTGAERQRARFTVGGPTGVRNLAETLNRIQDKGAPVVSADETAEQPDEAKEEAAASLAAEDTDDEHTEEMGMARGGALDAMAAEDDEMTEEPERMPAGEQVFPPEEEDWRLESTVKAPPIRPAKEEEAAPDDEEDAPEDEPEQEEPVGGYDAVEEEAAAGEEAAPEEEAVAEQEEAPEEEAAAEQEEAPEEEAAAAQEEAPEEEAAAGEEAAPEEEAVAEQEEAAEEESAAEEEAPADEQDDYRRVYEEFVRAKKEIGSDVAKLTFERFVRKLKKQEEVLKSKHACRAVHFQVNVKDGQVSLRPRILR